MKQIAFIQSMLAQFHPRGRNDSEYSRIQEILNQLNSGSISPEKAMEMVSKMESTKQDYN